MERVGSIVIDLVDEDTATPAYALSWEDDGWGWGPNPGDDGNFPADPIGIYACGCGSCHGTKEGNACSGCAFKCPPDLIPPGGGGTGGGGGGGGDAGDGGGGSIYGPASSAKIIFKSTSMTDAQWVLIEQMITEIRKTCMGQAIYDALAQNNKRIDISFDPNLRAQGAYVWSENSPQIILRSGVPDHFLLHEMFHAYQDIRGKSSSLNGEIEAWVAQYKYDSSDSWTYTGSEFQSFIEKTARGREIQRLADALDDRGVLFLTSASDMEDYFRSTANVFDDRPSYSDTTTYPLHSFPNVMDNFTQLAELSANCQP